MGKTTNPITLKTFLTKNKKKVFLKVVFLYEDILNAVKHLNPTLLDMEVKEPEVLKGLIEKSLKANMLPDIPDWESVVVEVIRDYLSRR